jgi:guanylate kinase
VNFDWWKNYFDQSEFSNTIFVMTTLIRPICISGPSGVGKGTIIEALLAKYPEKLHFAISHTTRQPRGKEQNGVEYNFIAKDEFKDRIEMGEFIEYAEVHGNYYGHSTGVQ